MENKVIKTDVLVTIIVSADHQGLSMQETFQSVLEQTYQNLQIILLNDLKDIQLTEQMRQANRQHSHVTYIEYEGNEGLMYGYNLAIQQAQGAYIALLKVGDIMDPKRIEKQLNRLETHSEEVLTCGDMEGVDAMGKVCHPSYYQHNRIKVYEEDQTNHLIQTNFVLGNTLFFRREIIEALFPISTQLPYEDWWIGVGASIQGKVHYMDEVLGKYRIDAEEKQQLGRIGFMKQRVEIAKMNALYYKAFMEYFRTNRYHYLAVVQPMELRDVLMSEYSLKRRMAYYYSEATYRCRRKIRMRERMKIQAYLWLGPYLLLVKR